MYYCKLTVTLQAVLHAIYIARVCVYIYIYMYMFFLSTTEKHNDLSVLPCQCYQCCFLFRIEATKVKVYICHMTQIHINLLYQIYMYVLLILLSHIDQCSKRIFCFFVSFLFYIRKSYVQKKLHKGNQV